MTSEESSKVNMTVAQDNSKKTLKVNVIGAFIVSREVSKYMKNGGAIVNVSSTNGTKTINLAVKRHANKFPERFMFQLNENEILSLNYRDFASLKVTKKTDKLNVICYELVVEIFAITEQSLDIYNLGDVEEILTKIKRSIEKLYSQIGLFEEEDLTNWVKEFEDMIASY